MEQLGLGAGFDSPEPWRPTGETLVVDLDGYEGPLDVLLALARDQKVDLKQISILQLAEQYLVFIARHRDANLELAADYLVMAAWLVYLKSRLLLPEPAAPDEPSGEEMAAALAFRLQRLEAMREAGTALLARPRLGRDLHPRGQPEPLVGFTHAVTDLRLYALLKAYGEVKRRGTVTRLNIEAPDLYSPDDAIRRMTGMLGRVPRWSSLAGFLPANLRGLLARSALSAHFCAALELCRQGRLELRQDEGPFGMLWLRPAKGGQG
ncbi:MAG TPA: segregation/condensation protein A [Rhodospirillaceae bacterium]|nr:segregation/condensation protein A [Rhodospirillaceae bacterium]